MIRYGTWKSEPANEDGWADDDKAAYMADMTLALYDSMGIEPPENPTVETVRTFLNLLEKSSSINVANN